MNDLQSCPGVVNEALRPEVECLPKTTIGNTTLVIHFTGANLFLKRRLCFGEAKRISARSPPIIPLKLLSEKLLLLWLLLFLRSLSCSSY